MMLGLGTSDWSLDVVVRADAPASMRVESAQELAKVVEAGRNALRL